MNTTILPHNHVQLALHTLRAGPPAPDHPLLILHGLGSASPTIVPDWAAAWPGGVFALDFTGHGDSTVPAGGGYTAEILLADADVALAHLGSATVVGLGLGGYVAVLLAGARPSLVRGAVIADGPGFSGGSNDPTSSAVIGGIGRRDAPDPYALMELGHDLRPHDYASEFAQLAAADSGLAEPITVVARFRPPWLVSVCDQPGVRVAATIDEALTSYAT